MNVAGIRSPLDIALLAACLLAVAASAFGPPDGALVTAAGAAVLIASYLWYWRRQMVGAVEEFARLRTAALAVQVLWLTVLYDRTATLLPVPEVIAGLLSAFLIAAGAAALAVAVVAAIDLSVQRTRVRPAVAPLGLALVVIGAQLDTSGVPPLVLGGLVLGLVAPMGWLITLERRERVLVLAGGVLALVPLGAAAGIFAVAPRPGVQRLAQFIQYGSLFCFPYVVLLLIRAAQGMAGAQLYERKVQELDAVYDFGLTASTVLDPEEFHIAVLRSLRRIGAPDVAAVVEPAQDGGGAVFSLLRVGADGEHVYRHHARTPWTRIAEQFGDRRPLLVGDHSRTQTAALQRIWEPAQGSSVSVPVLSAQGMPRAVLIAGRHRPHAFPRNEIRSLAGFASQVGLAMEHARLLVELVGSERRKRELEIARQMQVDLLPKQPPESGGLDIADRSVPATEVGGDYFDYLRLPDDHLGVVVGDVAGHGMTAGLIMAMAKSAIHTQVRADGTPGLLLPRLGEVLLEMSAPNQYMTMVFVQIDAAKSCLWYVNAGHHYPLHYRHKTGSIERLESTGPPLGLLPLPPGDPRQREVQPGDVLAFYSDGLVEASNPADEQFGIERLGNLLGEHSHLAAERIVDEAFRAVRRFTGDKQWHDDATMVVVRFLGE